MQLKIEDLRIGNWLQRLDGSLFQCAALDFVIFRQIKPDLHPKPIPLTEDWLVKFGFENGIEFKIKFNFFRFHLFQINKSNEFNDNINEFSVTLYQSKQSIEICRLKYVHELQNLYYALTNQELICN